MKLIGQGFVIILFVLSCSNQKPDSEKTNQVPNNGTNPVANTPKVFDYQPQAPINGELNAIIELGSLGLNYFIVNIDNEGRWKLVKAEYGRSNIIFGASTSGQILAKAKEYKSTILNSGVDRKKIYAVASSSFARSEGIDELASKFADIKIPFKIVDADSEGQYAMLATIPPEFIKESYLVDIGSGNTKLSWIEEGDTLTLETYGSKYFLNNTQDTTVFREVRDAVLDIPKKNRNLCFILGGAIYELVKDEIVETEKRYYVLKAPSAYPKNNEKLNAGNVIYAAIFSEPTYSYIFDNESNFSIGYLVSLKLGDQ